MVQPLNICLFQQIVYEEYKIQNFTAKIHFQVYITGKKIKKNFVIRLQLPKIIYTIWETITGLCGDFAECAENIELCGLRAFRAIVKFQDECQILYFFQL